jgi:tetratricopeptide (TPR) repeat protein
MFGFFRKKPATPDDDLNPNRAVEFFKRGDFQEALRRADAMIAAGPEVSLSWRFKGECLFSMERYAEAVEVFDKAESIGGPGTEDMFLWKALALHNGGESEQAKQVIRDFLASGKGAPEWIAKAKNALAQLG